ncbi:ankyrin repeat-containing domain protein, partial [Clohesyomyces aquaticus]
LLDLGLSIEEEGRFGSSLRVACFMDHRSVASLLLQRGALMDAQGKFGTALAAAAMRGCTGTTLLLIEQGADIELCASYEIDSPLFAIRNGHVAVVKLLVEAGA